MALHETARHLRIACAGLINYLEELNSRCVTCLRSVYNMLGRPQCCRSSGKADASHVVHVSAQGLEPSCRGISGVWMA